MGDDGQTQDAAGGNAQFLQTMEPGAKRAAVQNSIRMLATPVNVVALIADGVIVKRRAWYEVLDQKRLP